MCIRPLSKTLKPSIRTTRPEVFLKTTYSLLRVSWSLFGASHRSVEMFTLDPAASATPQANTTITVTRTDTEIVFLISFPPLKVTPEHPAFYYGNQPERGRASIPQSDEVSHGKLSHATPSSGLPSRSFGSLGSWS